MRNMQRKTCPRAYKVSLLGLTEIARRTELMIQSPPPPPQRDLKRVASPSGEFGATDDFHR